jgi:hypothetical protein
MKQLLFLLLCFPLFANAQLLGLGSNIVKVNLSSLALKNYSFSFERKISKRVSLVLGYRTEPKGSPPFQSQLENIINSSDINFSRFEIGNTAWTPEVRFYLGKGNMRGFYLAPYMRFSSFDVTSPVRYTTTVNGSPYTKDADFSGKITSTNGGLMIGTQHRLFKVLVIDIWIIGGHYGSSKGDLNFVATTPLNQQEQSVLKQNLDNINAKPFKFTNTVYADGSGAKITSDGPWAGIRGAGINIGFHF